MSTALPRPFRPRVRRGLLLYLGLGLLFGLYLGLNKLIDLNGNPHFEAWMPFTWEMSSVVVIFFVGIPLLVLFERHFPVDAKPRWRTALVHLGGALVFCFVHVAGMLAIRKTVYVLAGRHYDFGSVAVRGFYEFQKDLISYVVVLLVLYALRQARVRREGELRAASLAADLSEARLKHLTTQIEPHFLFNTLNAISNRMHEDVDAADRMISDLGALLRAAYDTDSQVQVPLESELGWLKSYAAMMSERFRGQLVFELHVAPGLGQVPVPRLLLQPLVENALRHGLPEGRGRIEVDVTRSGTEMHYRVSDDGAGLRDPYRAGTGLGNIARRLELLYPGAHALELRPAAPRGTTAHVRFPAAG